MRYVIVFDDGYRSDPLPWDAVLVLVRAWLRRDARVRPVRVEAAA